MGKPNVQNPKPSLVATNQSISVRVSSLDKWKLSLIAQEQGVRVEDILRDCVHRIMAEHKCAKAEIIKF